MRQHLRVLIILLPEMRLKVKERTHKTSVNVRLSESLTVPMCVTAAMEPLGKWTDVETIAVIEVKKGWRADHVVCCTSIYYPRLVLLF